MDTLIRKQYKDQSYLCRYSTVPFYYDTLDGKWIYGIGKNMSKELNYVSHKVAPTDNLDQLALKYYNNPSYWWVIAYFNDIQDSFIKLSEHFNVIKIPSLSDVEFINSRA